MTPGTNFVTNHECKTHHIRMTALSLSELEVLQRIVADKQIFANAIGPILEVARGTIQYPADEKVFVAINVPRKTLGLDPDQRPGDIDLLIVPTLGSVVMTDRIIAVEVKVVRPSLQNRSRNANSLGRTQALGLLNDGFPFVGLLHISLPAALPKILHLEVPVLSFERHKEGEFVRNMRYDPLPLESAVRQEGRLSAAALPPEIFRKALGLSISDDGGSFPSFTVGQFHEGTKNSNVNNKLIEHVRYLLQTKPETFTRIQWYDQ